ncbi:MAG: RNA-binding domain-containing protein [Candidatus Heimdallarchaeota archaeon]
MPVKEAPIQIKEIQFSTSAHATEDIQKVREALLNLLPEHLREKVEIKDTLITGHAGNEIHLLELKVSQKKAVKEILTYLGEQLNEYDTEKLGEEFEARIDQANCFYLRLNKQAAYTGQLVVDDSDNAIRLMIKFIIYKPNPTLIPKTLAAFGIIKKD